MRLMTCKSRVGGWQLKEAIRRLGKVQLKWQTVSWAWGRHVGVKTGYYSISHWCPTAEFSLPSLTLKEVLRNSTICLFPILQNHC